MNKVNLKNNFNQKNNYITNYKVFILCLFLFDKFFIIINFYFFLTQFFRSPL